MPSRTSSNKGGSTIDASHVKGELNTMKTWVVIGSLIAGVGSYGASAGTQPDLEVVRLKAINEATAISRAHCQAEIERSEARFGDDISRMEGRLVNIEAKIDTVIRTTKTSE